MAWVENKCMVLILYPFHPLVLWLSFFQIRILNIQTSIYCYRYNNKLSFKLSLDNYYHLKGKLIVKLHNQFNFLINFNLGLMDFGIIENFLPSFLTKNLIFNLLYNLREKWITL